MPPPLLQARVMTHGDGRRRFDIHLKYGDHLYSIKRDFKGAMEQYIKVIALILILTASS